MKSPAVPFLLIRSSMSALSHSTLRLVFRFSTRKHLFQHLRARLFNQQRNERCPQQGQPKAQQGILQLPRLLSCPVRFRADGRWNAQPFQVNGQVLVQQVVVHRNRRPNQGGGQSIFYMR